MLIQGRLERKETNQIILNGRWLERNGNQPNTFQMKEQIKIVTSKKKAKQNAISRSFINLQYILKYGKTVVLLKVFAS